MSAPGRRPKVFVANPNPLQEPLQRLRETCEVFVTPDEMDLSGLPGSDAVFAFGGVPYGIDDEYLDKAGCSVARKLRAFKPKDILYCVGKSRKVEAEKELGIQCVPFEELLARSDYVVLTCPLNASTKHLIDSKALSLMKKDAILVNTSRGGVIEQEALYAALKEGRIGGAALDVSSPDPLPPGHKMLKLHNLIALPHVGSATLQARMDMSNTTVDNILAALSNRPLPYPIPIV